MRWWEEWLRPRTVGVIVGIILIIVAPAHMLVLAIVVGCIFVALGIHPFQRRRGR